MIEGVNADDARLPDDVDGWDGYTPLNGTASGGSASSGDTVRVGAVLSATSPGLPVLSAQADGTLSAGRPGAGAGACAASLGACAASPAAAALVWLGASQGGVVVREVPRRESPTWGLRDLRREEPPPPPISSLSSGVESRVLFTPPTEARRLVGGGARSHPPLLPMAELRRSNMAGG